MLDRQDAIEASLVQAIDDARPVHLTPAWDAVTPPSGVPRVTALIDDAEESEPVASPRVELDVLGLGVHDPLGIRANGLDGVDADPHEMGRVPVQVKPEGKHPLPQLGRVGDVA